MDQPVIHYLESQRLMMTKTKLFPSQIKYRQNNPAISFRVKKADKEKLDKIIKASGKPLSKWMTDFIRNKMDPKEELSKLAARVKVLEEKNKELATEERFTLPCSVCGKPLALSSKQSNWKTKIYPELMKAFGKWAHTTCIRKESPSATTDIKKQEASKPR